MDIPELVEAELGDEPLRRGVMIGDEDVVCITPTRTLLYRAEGLLSDESVEEFPHAVERLTISEGRRKTKFLLSYVEDERSLTVPNDIARDVLGLLLEGVLTAERILDDEEAVVGAFRFSELTLVVADNRVVKHVGNAVWEDDFEMFHYEDLSGLEFAEASVATEVVLRVDGRPQRIKTPNDQARVVEQTLKQAVFDFFDVSTMGELDALLAPDEDADEAGDPEQAEAGSIGLDSGIDPLVDDRSGSDGPFDDPAAGDTESPMPTGEESVLAGTDAGSGDPADAGDDDGSAEAAADEDASAAEEWSHPPGTSGESAEGVTQDDLAAVTEQLSELTEAVNRQNELLRNQNQTLQKHQQQLQSQGKAIKQLIEELRQGR